MNANESPDPEWSFETADPEYLASLARDQYTAEDIREHQDELGMYITFDSEKVAEEMGLNRHNTFTMNGKAHQVKSMDTRRNAFDRDSLTVTDPTDNHPQSSRAGRWGVPLMVVLEEWKKGDATPGKLRVEAESA